jgi:hypothetical protein
MGRPFLNINVSDKVKEMEICIESSRHNMKIPLDSHIYKNPLMLLVITLYLTIPS